MCGKDPVTFPVKFPLTGSPPHVREGLISIIKNISAIRITPACAGRTKAVYIKIMCSQDHPRMCGKDSVTSSNFGFVSGSPPHVREGRSIRTFIKSGVRITPACAGRTKQKSYSAA